MTDPSGIKQKKAALREAIQVLDAWGVPFEDQPAYLGLPSDLRRRDYNKYRLGTVLPDDLEVYERVRLINRIHRGTMTIFPFSEEAANLWVQVPQRPFGGQSALEVMRQYGLAGMRQIDLAVDNQFHPLYA